ncbi:response regulator [Psychromonas sp. Urea-02u-13]|uniref:response regulator n=1 Tax=Psychromonas sp. Urea-02u-13 TaxID=2058326 RepID=UPI000C333F07|nr:response regulator [Psychromonas sp. Urea-02u-13]PKG39216.1 DNA-binding response regulator [Psychromonas sp. Urea-02u-13]
MKNLLLIDDDKELVSLLAEFLSLENFNIDTAPDGESGLQKALATEYDLILLDVMMPRMNGFEMLKLLRQKSDTPVLILTAKGDEIDKVLGLEMGADDYLAKPFSERELLARIRAILRRTQYKNSDTPSKITHLDIELFPTQHQAICQDFTIELTGTELLLLEKFLAHPGELFSKAELSEEVLGKKLQPFDRSIDMHLSNIRRKLPTRADGQTRVKNFRGRGYMWLEGDLNLSAAS